MDVVFLGVNNVGWRIYEWLCDRDGVSVEALITTEHQLSLVEEIQPDIVVAAGFDHIVTPEVLQIPPEGVVNVHPGYLPHTRGFNPNVWSIIDDLPAGATVHYMDKKIDTGEIISRESVEKSFADTGRSLYERIESACFDTFTDAWSDIESDSVTTVKQSDSEAVYHYQSEFEDLCRLDPEREQETKECINLLRALTFPPFNNAHININGEKYFLEVSVTPADEAERTERHGKLDSY